MKAFILDRYGSADRVRAGEMPEPELREDDVLVQIRAAGVNLLDSKIRSGEFKLILRYRLPLILGHDVAGVVVRVGSRVRRFKPDDEVYARPADGRIGAFAEFIAIKEDDVAMKPTALTMAEAASIPLVGLTAWQVLIERAKLKPGQKVLIHAGSGGVGTFAIQLAKHAGVDGILEVFNLLNHANYGSYVTAESNSNYGKPSSNTNVAYQPRMLQLGFRATF